MRLLRSHGWLAGLVLAVAAAAFAARGAFLYRLVEYKTLDWRFRAFSDAERADDRIVLLMLDQASLDHFERVDKIPWPWPRGMYKAVADFAKAAGARLVVLDILFTNLSPYGPGEDETLGEALRKAGIGVLDADFSAATDAYRSAPPPERFAVKVAGEPGPAAALKASVRLPAEELLRGAKRLGDADAAPDEDGVFRRLHLVSRLGGRYYPSVPLAAALEVLGADAVSFEAGSASVGGRRIPLADGRLQLRFHGAALAPGETGGRRTYESYSLKDVILAQRAIEERGRPRLEPSVFKDKILLVGYSAPGLMDNRPSPVSPVFPGTEILAVALDNLLNGDALVRAPPGAVFALILLAAVLGAAAARFHWRLGASTLLLGGLGLALAGAAVAAFKRGVWLDLVAPEAALFLSFAAAAAYSYVVEGRERRYIKGAFALYLSPEVVERIAESPESLRLAGERREVSLFFSDIEGFTTLSETLDPERLAAVMNRYLTAMTDIILESGGTLDKYIGDAIMAFWNAPLDCPDHALRACRAALLNQAKMGELRTQFAAEGLPPLRVRIGLNTGLASIGNLGSTKRFSYTAMGDEVNLASRLEGVNKQYGTFIMLSEKTRALAGAAIETRELDFIKVKGKNKPIRVYELLGLEGETPADRLADARRFEEGLAAYRERRWDEAERVFRSLPKDEPSALFLKRCEHFRHEPPPADWDGSYALKEK